MNKQVKILLNEPLLFIALPLSIVSLFLTLLLRPFVRIRFGFIRCDRIGHMAANTELYLCHHNEDLLNTRTVDLFYFPRPVCNQQLAYMWKRKLKILPWFFLRPLCLVVRSFELFKSLRAHEAKGGDRDIDCLFDKVPANISFTSNEEVRGRAILLSFGVPEKARFICLIVRDDVYLNYSYEKNDWSYHNHRDSDIQSYVLAAETLAERGYYVFRMGAKVRSPIHSIHPRVIDYATNGMRSDFMDIYLGAKCEFCISTSTGFDAVPLIFRRPIVYVNMVPIGWLFTFSERFLAITKHHFLVQEDRGLTLREIFDRGVGYCASNADYGSKGVRLIDNTPEEIRDVVLEMADRLEGKWVPNEEGEALQERFWRIFPKHELDAKGVPLHGEIRSRFGENFLRNNQLLLGH
jgi:putative glycosyltransferase (TIGR04372 family)